MTNCEKRTYSPVASSLSDMPATGPERVHQSYITLQYPLDTPTSDIDIRNPNYGDQEILNLSKVFNRSRSGSINISESLHKPKTQTITYTIENLCDEDKIALLNFIEITLGHIVRLIDYEGIVWNVIIINPSAALSELSREMPYSFKLRFKGSVE